MATTQQHHYHSRYRDYQQQQQQQHENDWENDFISSNNNIFSTRKAGVFTMYHEKELTLACERYQYPAQHFYLEDDDTASSVTSGSILSEIAGGSRFSELDSALNDIDEFMYDEPPPATFHCPLVTRSIISSPSPLHFQHQPQQQPQQKFDRTQFPGVVKRLGSLSSHFRYTPGGIVAQQQQQQQEEDNDDWADDVDMPKDGFSALNPVKKIYEQLLDDDEEDDDFIKEATAQQSSNRPNLLLQPVQQQKISLPTTTAIYQPVTTASSSSSRPILHYQVEREEDDDEDMTGLDFPENMAILPKRLDEKKRYNPITNIPQQQPATSRSTRIPISTNKLNKSTNKYLSMAQREKDDDDFMDGLVIQDAKSFNTSIAVPPLNSSTLSKIPQQKMTLNKTKEAALPTKSLVSRLARPTPLYPNGSKQSDHADALAKKASSPNLRQQRMQQASASTTATNNNKHTFLAGTKAPCQRETDIAAKTSSKGRLYKSASGIALATESRNLMNRSIQNNSMDQQPVVEKKSANGYTLIARPKTKVTKYISRLDHIDNLNDLCTSSATTRGVNAAKRSFVSNSSLTTQQKMQPKRTENKLDPDRPWRRNMQTTSSASNSRSGVKLIQPDEQNLKKEYNDMKYDDSTHCWKGNETSLIEFQEKPTFRRPMLIMNKQQKNNAPSRYAAVVGSSMIFNTDLQKWVSANGSGEEFNELDTIEDLKDELLHAPLGNQSSNFYNSSNNSSSHVTSTESHHKKVADNKLLDFKLSIEVKRQMMFEQEQHETWMSNWFPSQQQQEESYY